MFHVDPLPVTVPWAKYCEGLPLPVIPTMPEALLIEPPLASNKVLPLMAPLPTPKVPTDTDPFD